MIAGSSGQLFRRACTVIGLAGSLRENAETRLRQTLALPVSAPAEAAGRLVCVRRQILEPLLLHQRIDAP